MGRIAHGRVPREAAILALNGRRGQAGVGLLVGESFVIADYYDLPLSVIHDQLKSYWGGREAN